MNIIRKRSVLGSVISLIAAASGAATFTWSGAVSSDWNTPGNWTNNAVPGTNGTDDVWLMATGNPPTNQNIPNLYINVLGFNTNAAGYTVGGNTITIKNLSAITGPTAQTNTLNVPLVLAANNSWTVNSSPSMANVVLNGPVGETGGSRYIAANGNGTIFLVASNSFTGGLRNNQSSVRFYSDASLGAIPSGYVSNFFQQGYGSWMATTTGSFARIDVHTNRGWFLQGNAMGAQANIKLILNMPVCGSGNYNFNPPVFTGTLLLGADNGGFTGPVTVAYGTAILMHSNALGSLPGRNISQQASTVDLNGYDCAFNFPNIWNNTGFDSRGCIVNSNTNRPSTLSGNVLLTYNGSQMPFGGAGDIIVTGCISSPGNYSLNKTGSGALVLKGTNNYATATYINNGSLTLDYTLQNSSKVGTNAGLYVSQGVLRLIGSDSGPTVQTIGDLGTVNIGSHTYIRLEAGQDQNLTLAAKALQFNYPYDVTLVNRGAGVASLTVTNADMSLASRGTWNRSTWAKVASGAITGMSAGEYVSTFTNYAHVNLTGGSITNAGTTYAATLRSDIAAGTTINISNGASLHMDVSATAGILMSSNSGPVIINGLGSGRLYLSGSGPFVVHQYSPNPLTLASRIDVSNGGDIFTKCGPGEAIVLGTNQYQGAAVYGGTLTIGNIANAGAACAIGSDNDFPIANGTLKYIGPVVAHNHRFILRGPGTIDASGSGVFEFTAASNVVQNTAAGNDHSLTLTGTGAGMMDGVLDLHMGSVTKTGTGTWTIKGTQPYTGNTTVNEGTMCFSNSCVLARSLIVNTNGTIAGSVTVQEDLVMNGTRRMEIRGDSDYDTLTVGYDATMNGSLSIVPVGSYRLTPNLALPIVTAGGSLSGSITNTVVGGYTLQVSSDGKQLLLSRRLPGFIFSLY